MHYASQRVSTGFDSILPLLHLIQQLTVRLLTHDLSPFATVVCLGDILLPRRNIDEAYDLISKTGCRQNVQFALHCFHTSRHGKKIARKETDKNNMLH